MARRVAVNEVRPVLEAIDKELDVVEKGLDAIEKGADVATDVVDKSVHVAVEEARQAVGWLRNPKTAAIVFFTLNAALAGAIGWKLAKRHYTKKFEQDLEVEIAEAKQFYTRLNKTSEDLTPEKLAKKYNKVDDVEKVLFEATDPVLEKAADALKEYKGGPAKQYNKVAREVVEEEIDEVSIEQNIFVNGESLKRDDFDIVEELKTRDPERPYVISAEEFEESEFPQPSITYYAGDDILADDKDQPIDNVEDLVGIDNLSRFGHGSGDKNIVYIRNERTEVDFEVAYSSGKFSEEVHGFIQHSDRPVRRKMRRGDDE